MVAHPPPPPLRFIACSPIISPGRQAVGSRPPTRNSGGEGGSLPIFTEVKELEETMQTTTNNDARNPFLVRSDSNGLDGWAREDNERADGRADGRVGEE